ncbi:MAG: MopE-related protein, partial [Myxococcota bacterium]|nr:MopE-related protein [Myxococcota bacterium]
MLSNLIFFLSFSSFIACEEPPEVILGELSISHAELDFGSIPTGTVASQTFTIQNTGNVDFAILSASLLDGDANVWTVSKEDENELSNGDSLDILVEFSPLEIEVYDGSVEIRTTLEEHANLQTIIRGEGSLSTLDNDNDGHTPYSGDCDDNDANVYPGAEEICDGKDSDCDGLIPDDEADADRDQRRICAGDCDDNDDRVYPEAEEICDGKDSDCDGLYADHMDLDADGTSICEGDCDDTDPAAWPGNPEICDEVDNNCSGEIDDIDFDGDGYGPCTGGGDCDDNNPNAHPVILDFEAETAGDGTVEFPYSSLEAAVNGMDELCRTIAIFPGTYSLSLDWSDGSITFNGLGDHPSEVVISPETEEDEESPAFGDALDRLFDLTTGGSLKLVNLTLQNGIAENDGRDGGAIRSVGADVELDTVILRNNTATADGGAVSITGATLTTRNILVQNNNAE